MANTLTAVIPQLLAQGLMALRENAITPQIVNRGYSELAGQRGSTIDVPIPSAIAAQAVSPGPTPPANTDVSPTSVSIPLDQWYEAPFYLTDKEMLEVMQGHIPMQASEAIKSLANTIDDSLLAHYSSFYGFHGNLDTGAYLTPFEDASGNPTNTKDATKMRTILNKQLAPLTDRHVLMNPDTEGAALNIRAFQDMSFSGDPRAIIDGNLNNKLGFQWWMDQNMPTHTAGTAAGEADIAVDNAAGYAIGTKTLNIDEAAGTNSILVGDIVSFAGHSQTYVVTETIAALDALGKDLKIEPGLQVAVADNEAITVHPSHAVNLAMHRDAIAFATRPLAAHGSQLGVISSSVVDPISGLSLRLEVTHQHKQLRFSYDVLWGSAVVRREFGSRLGGLA